MKKSLLIAAAAAAVWLATSACQSPPVESPATRVVQQTPIRVPQNEQNKVDILFLVDNSPSMDAMQTELRNRFGDFLKVFQDLALAGTYADLHIGVVTSDYGAGVVDGQPGSGCFKSPGGQLGYLQALGAKAPAGCQAPTGGTPFIRYAFTAGGSSDNLPAGQGLVETFTCMASVGSAGCGFEHQLESVYAGLKNTQQNAGFIRADALLTVVFVTNEDDGSAPPTSDIFDPDASKVGMLGAYDTYRQTHFGVACQYMGSLQLTPEDASGGPLSGCVAAENDNMVQLGSEFDISRYINLFGQPPARGGVKIDPTDNVILVGIDAPDDYVETILATRNTGNGVAPNPKYVTCSSIGTDCLVRVQHSCQNNLQPGFFGDPSVRLNAVIRSAHYHQIASICGDDPNRTPDYSGAMQAIGQLISSAISPGCLTAELTSKTDPQCVVQDVTENPDGSQTIKELPRCDLAGGSFPCWRIEVKAACAKFNSSSLGVTIDRNNQPAPANTNAHVECSTIAQ